MPEAFARPEPATLRAVDRLRLWTATRAGDVAALGSRLAGRGSGASVRGQVLTRLAPQAFEQLLAGRRILAVSGTNGKTTTAHLLTAAIRAGLGPESDRVVSNADGANLHYGIASALSQRPKADIAVLETDERVIPDLVAKGHPEILVWLNFSRDQLDRNHELKSLARAWRQALTAAGASGPTVVANASDPLVAWAAEPVAKVIWVQTNATWTADSMLCPECGTLLARSHGRWSCTGCRFTQPRADYVVAGRDIELPNGRSVRPALQLPGSFNLSNAACALAAAVEFGVDANTALAGMSTVESPAGRFSQAHIGQVTARLLLAKNPAGWTESLPLATTNPLVLAIDAVAADGKDLSWLWDVPFEQLAGRQVLVTGPRSWDLAVRLEYAGVEPQVTPDLGEAFAGLDGQVDVIATYTPFQRLLKMAGLR